MTIRVPNKLIKEIHEKNPEMSIFEAKRQATRETVIAKIDAAESFKDLRVILQDLAERLL